MRTLALCQTPFSLYPFFFVVVCGHVYSLRDRSSQTRDETPLLHNGASLVTRTVKTSACNVGDWGEIHGSGRSPGEGNGNSLQYSCLENSMDRGAWRATYSSWGCKESDTAEQLRTYSTHRWNRLPQFGTQTQPKPSLGLNTTRLGLKPSQNPVWDLYPRGWDLSPAKTHSTWFQDLMKLRLLMSHHRKNSVRDKVKCENWIYSDTERNTFHRQSVGHCRGWMHCEIWCDLFL